MEQELKKKRLL